MITRRLSRTAKDDVIQRILQRKRDWESYWSENKISYDNDYNFFHFSHWNDDEKRTYLRDQRLSLEFKIIDNHVNQILSEFAQSKFSPDIYPINAVNVNDETAKNIQLRSDLLEYIYHNSSADCVHRSVFKNVIIGGYGASRVSVHKDDDGQNKIKISHITDPALCGFDPMAKSQTKSDGRYCYVLATKSKEWLQGEYPRIDWDNIKGFNEEINWITEEGITIIDYWEKVKKDVQTVRVQNGEMLHLTPDEASELDEQEMRNLNLGLTNSPLNLSRKSRITGMRSSFSVMKREKRKKEVIHFYRISADEVLDHTRWDGTKLPCVMCTGSRDFIKNKEYTKSFISNAKEPQRAVNMINNELLNTLKNRRHTKILAPDECIAPYQDMYKDITKYRGALPYKPSIQNGIVLKPEALPSDEIPTSLFAATSTFFNFIGETLGRYDASLGKDSQEVSGAAIFNRQMAANISAYLFFINAKEWIEEEAQVVLDLMPKIYDNTRTLPIINEEKGSRSITINKFGDESTDMTIGSYSVVMRVGATFRAQREINYNKMSAYIQSDPAVIPYVRDFMLKNIGIDEAPQIIDRLRSNGLIPPQVILKESDDVKEKQQAMIQLQQQQQQQNIPLQMAQQRMQLEAQRVANDTMRAQTQRAEALATINTEMTEAETNRMEAMAKGVLESHKIQAEQARTNAQLQESAFRLAKDVGKAAERPIM